MNCSFNIRYKPRTTRAFTKSDLTVYDSAGNTALNALTVYGKSEVVDGAITSAGEGGSIEIETCQKNLLDPTKLVTENITYTEGVLSGTAGSFHTAYSTGIPVLFNKARQITFSIKAYTDGLTHTGRGLLVIFVYEDNTTDILYMLNATTEPQVFTLTSNAAKQIQYIGISYGAGASNMWYLSEIQLEYGSQATTYEPYNGTMAVFETGTPLRGIPDTTVRDVMAWNGSSGAVTKNCGKVRLADLTWTSNVTGGFAANLADSPRGIISLICSKYPYDNSVLFFWDNFNNYSNKTLYRSTGQSIYIKDTDYATESDFIASLGDTELVYELATPTTQNLTPTENASLAGLRTFQPQTHAQNNAQTDMTVDYTIRVPTI